MVFYIYQTLVCRTAKSNTTMIRLGIFTTPAKTIFTLIIFQITMLLQIATSNTKKVLGESKKTHGGKSTFGTQN